MPFKTSTELRHPPTANLPQITIKADLVPDAYPGHDPFMTRRERATVIALLRHVQARTVTETGVQEGRGAALYLRHVPTLQRYLGVDVQPEYQPKHPVQAREVPKTPGRLAQKDPRFELLLRPRGSLDLRPQDLPSCEAFIIDGDHGAEAVEHDTELAQETVRPGGLIIWHDYYLGAGPLEVKTVLDRRAKKGSTIFHVEGTWLAIERR